MSDNIRRNAIKTPYRCDICAFDLWLPIGDLSCSSLGLYDDARFPGRCILVLHRHVEAIVDVSQMIGHQLIDDIRRAENAIRKATGTTRLNWAVLGNVEPHLHVHLVPRSTNEPLPDRSPLGTP